MSYIHPVIFHLLESWDILPVVKSIVAGYIGTLHSDLLQQIHEHPRRFTYMRNPGNYCCTRMIKEEREQKDRSPYRAYAFHIDSPMTVRLTVRVGMTGIMHYTSTMLQPGTHFVRDLRFPVTKTDGTVDLVEYEFWYNMKPFPWKHPWDTDPSVYPVTSSTFTITGPSHWWIYNPKLKDVDCGYSQEIDWYSVE